MHYSVRYKLCLKIARHVFIQSKVKPKPILSYWAHKFCYAPRHLLFSRFDWFTGYSARSFDQPDGVLLFWFYVTRLKTSLISYCTVNITRTVLNQRFRVLPLQYNHPCGSLRKQKFTSKGSKGRVCELCLVTFPFTLFVSFFSRRNYDTVSLTNTAILI